MKTDFLQWFFKHNKTLHGANGPSHRRHLFCTMGQASVFVVNAITVGVKTEKVCDAFPCTHPFIQSTKLEMPQVLFFTT